MSLYKKLTVSVKKEVFSNDQEKELVKAIEDGYAFFSQFNRSRMELAFSNFSEDMKKALFETIFFLHVNDPKFEEHQFLCTKIEKVHGVKKEVEVEEIASLYVEGALSGVVGIGNLAPIFKDEFQQYAQSELDTTIQEDTDFKPIYSIASLGSIGTVGHKQTASDLDLQVQYELDPFLFDEKNCSDQSVRERCFGLINYFSKRYQVVKKVKNSDLLKNPALKKKLTSVGHHNFKKRFPSLYAYYFGKDSSILSSISTNSEKRSGLLSEFIEMHKLHASTVLKKERIEKEALLKEKIHKVQAYVQKKFPQAEVYLFAYSNDDYRDGKHGTTLESKEASGSAYELILNYEVLMPGIQFSPMIPIHFLMPGSINSDRSKYEAVVEKIRFGFTDLYDKYRQNLVDLGSTPPMTSDYMVSHSGAIYWESFKASSGNLPKAMLNLLRFEMLFDQRFNTSVIELVKNPRRLDRFAGEKVVDEEDIEEEYKDYDFDDLEEEEEDDFYDDYGLLESDDENPADEVLGEEDNPEGMSIEQIFKMEERFPTLRQDPWWLRYKALKIGFGPENQSVESSEERIMISRVIDMGFALHIRVSDIFVNIRESKKPKTYREKFLMSFLEKAFTGKKRRNLEHISNGVVESVIKFEEDLKYLFQRSMDRVQKYVEEYGGEDKTNQDENRIWFHYYQKNFDPPKNVVRRDILSDLKVPRGRLQIGYSKEGNWFFKSIQKSGLAGSRYDTLGQLDHLPDEVELFEHVSFLHGIAHCILNGYYGVLNKGTLKESRTVLEFSVAHTELGKRSADQFAFIRPDIVDRLVDNIDQAFPAQEYDFRDCIYKDKEVTNVFICLNLLEYGRVSFMYRDNLKNWCVDEVDHPKVEKAAQELHGKQELVLRSRHIQNTIKEFFSKHKIDFDKITTSGGLSFWVNPNSITTYHSADKFAQKEEYLAKQFKEVVFEANSDSISLDEELNQEIGEITEIEI